MSKHKYKVLVAEDEVLILENIVQKISAVGLGFEVVATANNGRIALEAVERFWPDVVITDIKMPLMDGLNLAQRVDDEYPHIKKIIISGFSDFEYARHAMRNNVFDYLLKPVKEDDLRKSLLRVKAAIDHNRDEMAEAVGVIPEQLTLEDVVEYIRQYIHENYKSNMDLNALTASFNYSPEYINRLFVKHYGESPSKYQIHLRINEAKKLLLDSTDFSVKQVSETVGYEDQSYFSRIFKKYTCVSPLEYRGGEAARDKD